MRKYSFTILIAVVFISCQEQGMKVSPYDLESFVRAEALGASDAIRDVTINFKIEKGKEMAICDAIYDEIEEFDESVQSALGLSKLPSPHVPPKQRSGETDGELAVRFRASKLYLTYRKSLRDAHRTCVRTVEVALEGD
jgi:hypothetical protein